MKQPLQHWSVEHEGVPRPVQRPAAAPAVAAAALVFPCRLQGRAVTLAARWRFPPGRHSIRQTFHYPLALQRRHTCRSEVVCSCFDVAGVEGVEV